MTYELNDNLRDLDDLLSRSLGNSAPDARFEDRIIGALPAGRINPWLKRLRIHPAVLKSAGAVAAILAVAAVGHVGISYLDQANNARVALSAGDAAVRGTAVVKGVQRKVNAKYDAGFGINADQGRAGQLDIDFRAGSKVGGGTQSINAATDIAKYEPGSSIRGNWSEISREREVAKNLGDFKRSDNHASGAASPKSQTAAPANRFYDYGITGKSLTATNSRDGQSTMFSEGLADFEAQTRTGTSAGSFYDPKDASNSVASPQKPAAVRYGINDLAFDAEGDGKKEAAKSLAQPAAATPTVDGPAPANAPAPQEQPARPAPAPAAPQEQLAVNMRKIIRSGEMTFEVDSFDSAVMTLTKLAGDEGGFVASTDSNKLPNGKMMGTVVVRMAPEHLDRFVLSIKALGELKSQRIGAQDITKQYTDLESQLRAARAMEERLLDVIKKGTGQIKDLVAAEKELGVWREKIEKVEGEKRYYDNQVGLSTLSITLAEKDIKAAAGAIERESVDAGVEAEDVEKARAETTKAIEDAKGRVISSDLKKLDAGQFAARIVAELPPENSGLVTDRLRQLGNVTRMNVDRKQSNTDGSASPLPGSRVEKKPTSLAINFYNVANVAPRKTSNATLAVTDVESTRSSIVEKIEKLGGRVVSSSLNKPQQEIVSASVRFETKSADAEAMLNDLRAAGEMMNLSQTENPDTASVTNAKRGFDLQIISLNSVAARETTNQQLAARSVTDAHAALLEQAKKLGGRVLASSVSDGQRDQTIGNLEVEIPRAQLAEWTKALSAAGDTMSRNVARSVDLQNTIDSKLRYALTIYATDKLPPREMTIAGVDVGNAEAGSTQLQALAQQLGGRIVDSSLSKDSNGLTTSRLVVEVSTSKAPEVLKQLRGAGDLSHLSTTTNQQMPEGQLAQSRFDVTFSEGSALVGREQGLWASVRDGFAKSIRGLGWSIQLLVVGLCLIAPWALIVWGGWRWWRKRNKPAVG